ncbi:hypothetical protein [Chryseobacterium sp. MP_3.2]|uniref:hypothetical protein n=1 Tax=Chryseobacterium sp. MP_3.2 TaxID=3071712 RepID=UPI002E08B14F|nr:integrase/recombinase [Chryseobacterium sp. MP_3.2]
MKRSISYIGLILIVSSCTAEKINLSPIANSFTQGNMVASTYTLGEKKDLIIYSSEITNLISTFPKFRNNAVNLEIKNLQTHLKDYIGALESYDNSGISRSNRKFEQSYRNLQNLRKNLNGDDDEVLNRYLVKIKTNMSRLNNFIPKDSINATLKN